MRRLQAQAKAATYLLQLIFIEGLRAHLASDHHSRDGGALSDRRVADAIHAFHGEPVRDQLDLQKSRQCTDIIMIMGIQALKRPQQLAALMQLDAVKHQPSTGFFEHTAAPRLRLI